MLKMRILVGLCLAPLVCYAADPQQLPVGSLASPDALAKTVPALAKSVIEVYREADRRVYLDNLFRLQLARGADADAARTIDSQRALDAGDPSLRAQARHLQYSILAQARARQAASKVSFEKAFAQAFRDTFARLDDKTSAHANRLFIAMDASALQRGLAAKLEHYKGRTSLSVAEALDLIKSYQAADAFSSFGPLTATLIAEERTL